MNSKAASATPIPKPTPSPPANPGPALAPGVIPTSEPKLFGSLSLRIMMAFVALIGAMLMIVIGLVSLTLRLYLTDEVDRSLISSGRIIATQTVDRIVNGSQVQVIPSDFYFYIDLNYTSPIEVEHTNTQHLYGTPKDAAELISSPNTAEVEPFTAPGTFDGASWRAIVVPLQSGLTGESSGTVLIALPLVTVDRAVENLERVMVAIGLIIILLGGFVAYVMVQRSLRGVRSIEKVTKQVAAGNLASRVPPLPPTTEVGALAESINAMLAAIEHAFAVQQESEHRMHQFVSDASHELRTPLATVRGYAELYRMGGVPSEEVPHAFERIESESTRMGNLVEDLLKLARLDEGKNISYSQVDLAAAAADAVADVHARAPQRQASVIALDGGTPKQVLVMADKDKVEQVLANLLTNVLTHTPSDTAVEVAVGLNPRVAGEAIVEVRDHGPGIKASERKSVFKRFYRTDSSRSRNTGGTGLGLAIVAATLAAHGGTARLSETPGGGLTVTLTFPNAVAR